MQRLSLACVTWLLSISILLPAGSAQQSGRPQSASQVASGLPTQANEPSDQRSSIVFKDGRLSVDAQGRSLQLLLSGISDKTGVVAILDDSVAKQTVSVSFQGLALDEGLRRVLKNNDTFFFYGSDKDQPAALKVVWVYPKGKARGLEPVSPDKWASTKDLERMLSDPDPDVRGRAIETLVERKRQAALDAVLNSLRDGDAQVRTRALYGAEKAGVQLPEGLLNNLVVSDTSADVRFLALQALADSPNARSAAEGALNDPSEPVRHEAQEILARFDSAPQEQKPSQTPQAQPDPDQD